MARARWHWIGCTLAVLALLACGGGETQPAGEGEGASQEALEEPAPEPVADIESGQEDDEIDAESLSDSGTVLIKQYQAAWIGSGTLGKGTLTHEGRSYPFRIGGLGFGGFGVAAIDAHGTVYNMRDLESFAGAYGNARIGLTAADKGKGRLWLKNTNGVVIKLWTQMKGLALTGGVDGIVITWESDVQESIRGAKQGTQEAWDDTKQGSKKAWGSVKEKF
ncbi:MAG: hypothetical protein JRS35_16490 [Deltaproteobacteria bacterium]|nr:hypothetical protein [Deltaproteobacteria bacterium]